ncbi:MAG: hypothetical protein LBG15_03255 [Dysgonamonadaceae bacterium]|jgi:hypothetical protein|nr:hypothetical protein [Dysgonamonadaceae bacterium]
MEITPSPAKFELHTWTNAGAHNAYDVSNSIKEWKELEIEMSREDLSGVYTEISSPFRFVMGSYDIIESFFNNNGFSAKAQMYIYLRKNDWTYEDPVKFDLDFTTYHKQDDEITVNARKGSLYDFLKSKGKIKVDIPVSDIQETKNFRFDRIPLQNEVEFSVFNEYKDFEVAYSDFGRLSIGITETNTDVLIKDKFMVYTVAENQEVVFSNPEENQTYFIKNTTNESIVCGIKMNLNISLSSSMYNIPSEIKTKDCYIQIAFSKDTDGNSTNIYSEYLGEIRGETPISRSIDMYKKVHVQPGECLYLFLRYRDYLSSWVHPTLFNGQITGNLTISYNGIESPVYLPVISPKVLIQAIVNRITETTSQYQVILEDFNVSNDKLFILSAESVRLFTDAKIHTSYDDFKAWMRVLGYEPVVEENVLIFKKRNKIFNNNSTAMQLSESDCAGLVETVNEEYIFSSVKIGYNKKEYKSKNGRYEINSGSNEYSTDVSVVNNPIELVSPYRADGYGMEFLLLDTKNNDETKDNKDDNDVFFVNAIEDQDVFTAIFPSAVAVPDDNIPIEIYTRLINVKYNPRLLVEMNKNLLAVASRYINFKSMESNYVIIVDGKASNDDINLLGTDGNLFSTILYEFASKNIKSLPDPLTRNGLVKFTYKGNSLQGFIKKISKNPVWETETTWQLYGAD